MTIPFAPDDMGGYYHETGEYQLADIGIPTEECWLVVTWRWFQYDDPNGNWEDSTAGGDPPSDNGGGGGPPPPPPPPPPPQVPQACLDGEPDLGEFEDDSVSSANSAAEVAAMYSVLDASDATVCRGTNTITCMAANPGVWIGVSPIPVTFGFLKHAAIAITPPARFTELRGRWEYATNTIFRDHPDAAYNGGADGYRWVYVAPPSAVPAVEDGLDTAIAMMQGKAYKGGSNYFVSTVLFRAGIDLETAHLNALVGFGWAPLICVCGVCPALSP